jgi:hypothetical protein
MTPLQPGRICMILLKCRWRCVSCGKERQFQALLGYHRQRGLGIPIVVLSEIIAYSIDALIYVNTSHSRTEFM